MNAAVTPPLAAAAAAAGTTVVVPFDLTRWDEATYDAPAAGPRLTRATVGKRYRGALEGTSLAELLTVQGEGGQGYTASERVEGTLAGRQGTFVLVHGGLVSTEGPQAWAHVVPGSGTGGLAGLRGSGHFAHDAAGARLTLTFTL